MKKIIAFVFALASTPAYASTDPLTDFFDGIFQEANLHPHNSRIRARPSWKRQGWVASYYGGGERLNSHTANGERFRAWGYTAAHRTLPMGTLLNVCYRGCVTVRVNDRGPAAYTGRSLDLSHGAASAIGMTGAGVARVGVSVVQ